MKVKNGATDAVVGDGKKLYTGLTNVLVKAVNPSMEELVAMGYNPQQEPSYLSKNDKGNDKLRLDFYVENTETKFKSKISFWLENESRLSQKGMTQYIDDFNKAGWGDSDKNGLPSFVDAATAREAFVGEEDLMNFIYNWFNCGEGDVCKLETINAIVTKQDIKELRQMIKDAATHGVRVLVGVTKDNKYQTIYTKHFGRPYQKSTTYFTKALEGKYGEFKANYSLDWKEYTPGIITPDTEAAKVPAVADDLPF